MLCWVQAVRIFSVPTLPPIPKLSPRVFLTNVPMASLSFVPPCSPSISFCVTFPSSSSSASSPTYSHVRMPAPLPLSSTSFLPPTYSLLLTPPTYSPSTCFTIISPTSFIHLLLCHSTCSLQHPVIPPYMSPIIQSACLSTPPTPNIHSITLPLTFTLLFSHSLPSPTLPVLSSLLILPVLYHLTCPLPLSINLPLLPSFVPLSHLHLLIFSLLSSLPFSLSPPLPYLPFITLPDNFSLYTSHNLGSFHLLPMAIPAP